jgi:hypothetical protein
VSGAQAQPVSGRVHSTPASDAVPPRSAGTAALDVIWTGFSAQATSTSAPSNLEQRLIEVQCCAAAKRRRSATVGNRTGLEL